MDNIKSFWQRSLFGLGMILFLGIGKGSLGAQDKSHVHAELFSEVLSVQPGKAFWVGVRLIMDPHWHTYYKDPGDSGIPTSILWTLPPGFQAGDILWPAPKKIVADTLINYGYEGEVTLRVLITPPQELKLGQKFMLAARVDWLECAETCVPGRAELRMELNAALEEKPAQGSAPFSAPLASPETITFFTALLFAFGGGLLLNFMPCVLPVLSLKILGFLRQADEQRGGLLAHGTAYSAGVILSFWILAGILELLRHSGAKVGWGFQLQSPLFVGILAALFFLFALNLLGLFEWGTVFMRWGGWGQSQGSGPLNSFMSGAFATLAATPCTAPFMGSALGFALTQSPPVSFAMFTALGLGMSLPYFLLCLFPAWLRFLPKPGMWMVRLKQVLGLLLLLTVAWLMWVLKRQWVPQSTLIANSDHSSIGAIPWQTYSPQALESALHSGQVVFIDFTADWCLSCLVNERVALRSQEVLDRFKEKNILALKADWTLRDPVVTEALERLGRNGVPLYVLYFPGAKKPVILPSILTPKIMLDALDQN